MQPKNTRKGEYDRKVRHEEVNHGVHLVIHSKYYIDFNTTTKNYELRMVEKRAQTNIFLSNDDLLIGKRIVFSIQLC